MKAHTFSSSLAAPGSGARSLLAFVLAAVLSVAPSRGQVAPVPADIVSWWAGEDNALDIAGGVDGFPIGSERSTSDFTGGVVGRAFAFDGTNRYYAVFDDNNKHNLPGDLTIETWINVPSDSSGSRTILENASFDAQNVAYSLSISPGGKLTFSSTTAGSKTEVNTVAVVPLDQDVHVAVTLLAGDLRMFIDGQETAHIFFGTSRPTTGNGVLIGAGASSTVAVNFFKGKIDELSLYKRALTNAEIAGIHAAGASGKARYDAALNFETWQPDDTTQNGIWRYGEVQPETTAGGTPPVATFTELTRGAFGGGFGIWDGTSPLRFTGNLSGGVLAETENGATVTYLPGALTLRPGEGGRYAALKWTAPATGNYAFSAQFAAADTTPTNVFCRVLFEGAAGVFTLVPKSQLQGSNTVKHWAKIPLEAGEKIYFLVGDGANTNPNLDSTSVFANIVPLELFTSASRPTAVTGQASPIDSTTATLNGTVNPNGAATTYHFEYRTNPGALLSTPTMTLPSGSTAVPVSANLTGLNPNTEYFVFLIASNDFGSHTGTVQSFTTGNGTGVPFSVRLQGPATGALVLPDTEVKLTAIIEPASATATIASVQFFVDDQAPVEDTEAPFEFSQTVVRGGRREVHAIATDTQGRTATSPTLVFTVADAKAGLLALQTFITPASGEVSPGGEVTYLLVATNTSPTDSLKSVKVEAPIPRGTTLVSARIVDENNNPIKIKAPKGKNPDIAKDRSSVGFYFGKFDPNETKRARLTVRVPFDLHEGDDPIENRQFEVSGKLGRQSFSGRFAVKTATITGPVPALAPQLALAKGIVDLEDNKKDNTEFAETADGPVALTANGDKLTFLLVATNIGTAPASRVTVTDQVPDEFALDEGSARVNGKKAKAFLKVKGRTMTFTFGDFMAGESLVITYQLKVKEAKKGGPSVGDTVMTAPAAMHSANLSRGVDSAPERLSILILPPTTVVIDQPKALPEQIVIGGLQAYYIPYRNPSKREARNVRIRATIPEGTDFSRAFIEGTPGTQFPIQSDKTVTFNVGTVPPGEGGNALLYVIGKPELLDLPEPQAVLPPPVLLLADGTAPGLAESARQKVDPDFFSFEVAGEYNVVRDPALPKVGIWKIMPMSVHEGEVFACLFTVINHSKEPVTGMQFRIEIPDGTEFDHADQGTENSGESGRLIDGFFIENFDRLTPHETHTVRVFLRATGQVGQSIIEKSARVVNFILTPGSPSRVLAKPTATHIIRGDASDPDNQIAIARAQLTLENNDGAQAMADPKFLAAVRNITANSRYFFLNGVDGIQLLSGGAVVPTNGGAMVAAGGGNLVGNDGSTIENAGGATLIGQDGGTLIYAGPASEIIFNLVGNDGASLVGLDGSSLLDQVVRGLPGNMVAAGAGNLVAAGGGNLVRTLVGQDGSSITQLVGNDGASFVPAAALAASIRATGGDLFAVGVGTFLPSATSIVSNGEATMVAAGGGNMVAAGGGNLVAAGGGNFVGPVGGASVGGSPLISTDASSMATIGLDGSLIGIGGLNSNRAAAAGLRKRSGSGASSPFPVIHLGGVKSEPSAASGAGE